MDNKVEWVDTKPLNIEKSNTLKIDELQEDILANVYAIKRITNKFSQNRINEGKKIKDFYEVEFTLPNLIDYWGETKTKENDYEN